MTARTEVGAHVSPKRWPNPSTTLRASCGARDFVLGHQPLRIMLVWVGWKRRRSRGCCAFDALVCAALRPRLKARRGFRRYSYAVRTTIGTEGHNCQRTEVG
jgi:hypothetical protein